MATTLAEHLEAIVGPPRGMLGRIGPVVADFLIMQASHKPKDFYTRSTPPKFFQQDLPRALHCWFNRLDGPHSMKQDDVENIIACSLSPASLAVLLAQSKPPSPTSNRDHVDMLVNAAIHALTRIDADADVYAQELLQMRVVLGKVAVEFFTRMATKWAVGPVPAKLRLPALLGRQHQYVDSEACAHAVLMRFGCVARDPTLQFACSMWSAFSELASSECVEVSPLSIKNLVEACQLASSNDTFPYNVDKFLRGLIAFFEDDTCVYCF